MYCDVVYKCIQKLIEEGKDLSKCEIFCDNFAGEPIIITPDIREEEKVEDPCRYTKCPDCGKMSVRAKELSEGGGVVCTTPGCKYWFCY